MFEKKSSCNKKLKQLWRYLWSNQSCSFCIYTSTKKRNRKEIKGIKMPTKTRHLKMYLHCMKSGKLVNFNC